MPQLQLARITLSGSAAAGSATLRALLRGAPLQPRNILRNFESLRSEQIKTCHRDGDFAVSRNGLTLNALTAANHILKAHNVQNLCSLVVSLAFSPE